VDGATNAVSARHPSATVHGVGVLSIQPISRSATYSANRDWLASLHGTDQTETITLDLSKFTANTHYFASTTAR
jgi:hypothetical protein